MVKQCGPRFLTKSLFQRGYECPRKLAYAAMRYPESDPDDFSQALALDGQKIGRYAQWLYPEGQFVVSDDLIEKTRSLLDDNEDITLFEGAFESGNCFARADILRKVDSDTLQLIEVKSKSFDPEKTTMVGKRGAISAGFLPILRDVAFQTHVCRQAFPHYSVEAFLLLPNKRAVNEVPHLCGFLESDSEKAKTMAQKSAPLLIQQNVTELVNRIMDSELPLPGESEEKRSFTEVIEYWSDALENGDDEELIKSFPKSMGRHCRECEFPSGFADCWKTNKNNNLVLYIYRGGAKIDSMIQAGKYDISSVDLSEFSKKTKKSSDNGGLQLADKQRHQILGTGLVVDRKFATESMSQWDFPLHFVDFETIAPPLPYHLGMSPYQDLAFQFSHHTLYEDGTLEHASEFLIDSNQNPNPLFLDALSQALESKPGTVFRWGAHENTILASILKSENDRKDAEFLHNLLKGGNREMVDFMAFCGSAYYVDGSGASTSLKKLLLPTMKRSRRLRELYGQPTYNSSNFVNIQWFQTTNDDDEVVDPYSILHAQDGIVNGTDAMTAYHKLQDTELHVDERSSIRSSLLKYCELDSLAMVMIFQALEEFLGYDDDDHQ